jgi:hypothetical protein
MWTVPSAETEIFRFDLRAFEALLKAGGQRPPVDKQDKYEEKRASGWLRFLINSTFSSPIYSVIVFFGY